MMKMRKLSHLFGLLVLLALLPGQAFAQRWTKPVLRDAILQAYQENRIP